MPVPKMIKRSELSAAALFSAFMFAQFVILRLGNQAGRGYLPEERQELVYLFIQVAAILGFLGHAPVRSMDIPDRSYRWLTVSALVLCLSGAGILLFCSPASLFYLVVTGLCVLLLGYVGGAVYCRLAESMKDLGNTGLCIGVGYAAAVALQFCLQLQWNVVPALAVLLLLSFAVLTAIILMKSEHQTPVFLFKETPVSRSALVFSAVVIFALLIFTSYYNSYIHHLQIASGYTDYNVYSWPRLLIIPTVILFGFLGDIRGGRLLPLCTLCVAAIAFLNTTLLGRETYLLNMCLYYIAITAVIAYYHVTCLRLAPRTKRPALWACMGRIIDSAVVILSLTFGIAARSQVVVLVIDIAALAAAVVMMALSGAFNLSAPAAPGNADEPEIDPLPVIQEKFRITPSEMKVLRELVLTDDKQEVIASRLNISVSTLRHHITSLYKKTGAQTRLVFSNLVNGK